MTDTQTQSRDWYSIWNGASIIGTAAVIVLGILGLAGVFVELAIMRWGLSITSLIPVWLTLFIVAALTTVASIIGTTATYEGTDYG